MGLDFIRRAAKGFTKSWDRGRTSLATPSLFTRYPEARRRTVIAEMAPDCNPRVGAEFAICIEGRSLVLIEETSRIGYLQNPPSDLVDAIRAAGGCALGQISHFNPISGTADVEID
ncbi:MAG: hypothetical protein HEQ37_19250 [Acidovorax sp.]|nr:hypothetical protein [Acidovorax sp.]